MPDVNIARDEHTLTIEFACPEKANALTAEAVEAMLAALTGKNAEGLRLAIFTGQGRNLCAGFDLGDLETATDAGLLARMVRVEMLLQAIHHAPFFTLALAHGSVVGAGADVVCACALRTAAPGTTFRMPGWGFGVALGTRRLMHRVGADAARLLLANATRFDASRALALGFVQSVVPQADWSSVREEANLLASALPVDSLAELLSLTCPDTRAEDMAALVRTAGKVGLQRRILDYRRAAQAARGKPPAASSA
jgi:enoyl-CoA hydratase/carnithine racemase